MSAPGLVVHLSHVCLPQSSAREPRKGKVKIKENIQMSDSQGVASGVSWLPRLIFRHCEGERLKPDGEPGRRIKRCVPPRIMVQPPWAPRMHTGLFPEQGRSVG